MGKSKKKELVMNTFIIGLGRFSTQLVSFLLLPLYTSILSTEEYGIYDLIVTISTFIMPVITLLMEESMFRFLIDCKNEEEMKKVISQTFLYTCKGCILFFILAYIVNFFFQIPYLFISLMYIFSSILSTLKNSLIRGLGKIKLYTLVNFISSALVIVLNVLFIAVLKTGVSGLLVSTIIANIVIAVVIFIILKVYKYISRKNFDKGLMKKMIKYSIPLVPNKLSWTIINLSDRFIVSTVIGVSANGIYSMANKFPSIMNTFYSFFDTAWKESSAKALQEKENSSFFNDIFQRLTKIMFAISVGIIVCMPICFNWFFNESYNEAFLYIPILVVAMYYNNISGFYGGIFSAYKDTKIMGITTVLGALINFSIDIICINFLGVYAAALSTLVSCLVVCLYRKYKVKKYIKLEKNNLMIYYILTAVTIILYYTNTNIIIKVLNFVVVAVYAFYDNKDTILKIAKPAIQKVRGVRK